MSKADQISAELESARAQYLAIANTAPAPEVLAASRVVTRLQAALQTELAAGATPCPQCGTSPIGLLKTPEVRVGGNLRSGAVYEVGCPVCPKRRAQAGSPAGAVVEWNAGRVEEAAA